MHSSPHSAYLHGGILVRRQAATLLKGGLGLSGFWIKLSV